VYGYEPWPLVLREEHRLRMLQKVCRGECLDLRGRETRGWRELHNEEIHNLYSRSKQGQEQNIPTSRCGDHRISGVFMICLHGVRKLNA